MGPRLSVCIATQGRRNDKFVGLVNALSTQTTDYPGQVEIVAYWNNGELPIGRIRQRLIKEAKGEYVCFVDDDDKVPDYYVAEIMKALGEDYVGFEVQLFEKDIQMPRVFHSIRYGIWHQDDTGYYRGITHLNPIRRTIALQGKFGLNGMGEDEAWARSVTPLVATENYINKVMYYYLHNAKDTSFGGGVHKELYYERPVVDHPCFRWHPKSRLTSKG